MKNAKSTMRGYIVLGIFFMILSIVMSVAQMNINDMENQDPSKSRTYQVSESSEVDEDAELLEVVEIERIPDRQLIIALYQ